MLHFNEFIKEGRLGGVQLGSLPQDVSREFGEPGDVSVHKNPKIWQYGPIEFTFYKTKGEKESRLVSISYSFESDKSLPKSFSFEGWFPRRETKPDELKSYLKGAVNSEIQTLPGFTQKKLHLVADLAHIYFNNEQLQSVHVVSNEPSRRKQVTISVTDNVYEGMRREALTRKRSIPEVASAVIAAEQCEGNRESIRVSFDATIESDPKVLASLWKITKVANEAFEDGARSVIANWTTLTERGETIAYCLTIADRWNVDSITFAPDEIHDPTRFRLCLHELITRLLKPTESAS